MPPSQTALTHVQEFESAPNATDREQNKLQTAKTDMQNGFDIQKCLSVA